MNAPSLAKEKVSVVIPYFNQGLMLLDTLASIEQIRSDNIAEIIIVNDGSNEPATCRVLEDLDTSKYKIVHQPNQGLPSARNSGIEIATGEFILPLDGDDLIRSAFFDRGIELLIQNPQVGVVYGDAEYFGEKRGRWKIAEFDWRTLIMGNYIPACALYRKSVWELVDGYDESMRLGWEDWEFWMRVALRGCKFVHIDEIAFDYRVRKDSMVRETVRRGDEIVKYIFEKPEFAALKLLREETFENRKLRAIERSWDYKIGYSIVAPIRAIKRKFFSPSP